MSNADKIFCPVKPQGEYEHPGSLPVSCGSHATHKCKPVCLHQHARLLVGSRVHTYMHTSVCAQVHQWLLCGHVQAGAWLIFGIACVPCPSAESAWGQVGPGGLETSPSCCAQFQGSHPLASCPQSLPALAPVPWASRKAPGGPAPSPACGSPPPTPIQCRECATHFLPHLQSPSQSEPEENQAEQSLQRSQAYAHDSQGPSAHVDLCTQWIFAGTGTLHSKPLNLESVCTILITTHVHIRMQVCTH